MTRRLLLFSLLAIFLWRADVRPYIYQPRNIGGQFIPQRWLASTPIPYYIHSSILTVTNIAAGSDPLAVIVSAFKVWEGAANVQFQYMGIVSDRGESLGRDGISAVTFADTAVNRQFTANFGAYTIYFSDASGRIIESDIGLNPARTFSTSGAAGSTFGLITHEIGHTLGLDHSGVMASTMNGPPTGLGQVLTADDIAGALTLYPFSVEHGIRERHCDRGRRADLRRSRDAREFERVDGRGRHDLQHRSIHDLIASAGYVHANG